MLPCSAPLPSTGNQKAIPSYQKRFNVKDYGAKGDGKAGALRAERVVAVWCGEGVLCCRSWKRDTRVTHVYCFAHINSPACR